MTDVAAKTPGSWPGQKAKATEEESTAPRSAAPGEKIDIHADPAEQGDDAESHYTHAKDDTAGEAEDDLKEVEPEPIKEKSGGDKWSGWSKESLSAKAEMALKAKQLFDQASKARSQGQSKGADLPKEAELPNGSEVPNGTDIPNGTDVPKEAADVAPEDVEKLPEDVKHELSDNFDKLPEETQEKLKETDLPIQTKDVEETAGDATKDAEDPTKAAEGAPETVDKAAEEVPEKAGEEVEGAPETVDKAAEEVPEKAGETVEDVPKDAEKDAEVLPKTDALPEDVEGKVDEKTGDLPEDAKKEVDEKTGDLPEDVEGKVDEKTGDLPEDAKKEVDEKAGDVEIPADLDAENIEPELKDKLPEDVQAELEKTGELPEDAAAQVIENLSPSEIGNLPEAAQKQLAFNLSAQQIDQLPQAVRKALAAGLSEEELEALPEDVREALKKADFHILQGGVINKGGNIVKDGKVVGRVVEGELKHLVGKKTDDNGIIWSDDGKQLGRAEPLAENESEELNKDVLPFESFPDNVIDAEGYVVADGQRVGRVAEGSDIKKLQGMKVDADGDILDRAGTVIGHAERWSEPEPEPEPEAEKPDLSALKGGTVNKGGNVVVDGRVKGRVVEGALKNLIGKRVDENGAIWSDSGEIVGRAELIPESELSGLNKDQGPFEAFENAVVTPDGFVEADGERVGKVVDGDINKLRHMHVDADGDILDRAGNVIGKAERWTPEPEPEPEAVDLSILAGKRVNKAGYLVDGSGTIYGKAVDFSPRLIGKMANKRGEIVSETGDVIGHGELVSEGEREGSKEGPFAELSGLTVRKDGFVITPGGDVVGRLTSGDAKVLAGRSVDEDGDVLDRNGNVLGHAERYEEPEVEKKKGPMAGRRVNKEGNVVDGDGNVIGKLTSGTLGICIGKEIDDDGDVIDSKGNTIGHCNILEDIAPEGPSEEEKAKEAEEKSKADEAEKDRKLAAQLAGCIESCLDKVNPICKLITEKIDRAERTPEDERDEEELVREVRPLIEEAGRILSEANGMIRGLDPDGRLQRNAKHKAATREATPEEAHLAEVLKELTGNVTTTIDNAKKKLEGMPRAKKELNPLWGLLNEPLFQILGAVGLLLAGVLNLVGRLLAGLGLGGLIDGLLGTLGLNRVLDGLGLGSVTKGLTGGKDKKKKGGLLGGILG